MSIQAVIGIVRALSGLLEKVNAHGNVHLVKTGDLLHQGDILTLLSGEASILFLQGFPEVLSLNKSVYLDGRSPALEHGTYDINEALTKEAMAKGINVSLLLDSQGATRFESIIHGAELHSVDSNPSLSNSVFTHDFGALSSGFSEHELIEHNPANIIFVPKIEALPVVQVITTDLPGEPTLFSFNSTGDDTIYSGPGSDVLSGGGTGIDTFMWFNGDSGVDTITDFKANAVVTSTDAGVLNLADLLQGEHLDAASLDNYLSITKTGSDTTIAVDPAGTQNFSSPTQTIVLIGVDLTANNTISSHDIITSLIANGNLITD